MYILAYDFGTGGIKASLYGADCACIASGFDAYETSYPASGFHEQSPEDWWRATVRSTRLLAAQAGEESMKRVRALGISGHSLGVVPLDAAGNLLRPAVPIWSDSRAGDEAQAFFREVPEEAWYMKTGNGFPPALYSVFKLMWFREREPEWFGRAATILGTKDYINYRLCGVRATDFSYASGTGVYDLAARRYDEELIAASGLPRALFPEIVPATQVLGALTPDAARERRGAGVLPRGAGGGLVHEDRQRLPGCALFGFQAHVVPRARARLVRTHRDDPRHEGLHQLPSLRRAGDRLLVCVRHGRLRSRGAPV
jgi:xylulokinase